MKIYHYSQFMPGPNSVGPTQPRRLLENLGKKGNIVYCFACNYNVYSEKYENSEINIFQNGGKVFIKRFKTPKNLRKNNFKRLLAYFIFSLKLFFYGLFLKSPDVYLATIQPLFTGIVALIHSKIKKRPIILEVRDLWPDALEVKGALKGLPLKIMYKLSNMLYLHSNRIVCLTPGIKKELLKKGINGSKIDVFPNGVDEEIYSDITFKREEVIRNYDWTNYFIALYVGAHTEVTSIETIILCANELKSNKHIKFELFGDGQTKSKAIALAKRLNLDNIRFHSSVPKKEVPGLIASANVVLMCLFKSPLIDIYFENKLIDYMAGGKPIIAALDGFQKEIIEKANAGIVVPPLDYKAMAKEIELAFEKYENFKLKGENGRRYVYKTLLLSNIIDNYTEMIRMIANGIIIENSWEPCF